MTLVVIRTRRAGPKSPLRMGSRNSGRQDDPQWIVLGLVDSPDTEPYTAAEDGEWSITYDRATASRFRPEDAAAWILVVAEHVVNARVFWAEPAL